MEKTSTWWIEVFIIIIVFIIGLVGNIFVLIIVHEKNARKTIHGIFVTSLAVADLVLLCFDSPVSMLRRFDITSEPFNCKVNLTIVTTGYNAGLFTITSMAMHRCHIVTHPWSPKLKRRGAIIWVSLIWLAAFILVIPLIVVNKMTENGCKEVWPTFGHRQAYTASMMTIQYIIPLLITAICYIRIWLFLKRRPVMANNNGLASETEAPTEENTRESITILKTVAVIVLLFLVLLLPTQVAWMLLDFRSISSDKLWFASEILTRLHSCLNPVVYGVMNKQYRRSYVVFLSRMFCCRRSSSVEQAPPQRPVDHHLKSEDVGVNDDQCQQMSQFVQDNVDSRATGRHS
ncbi:neuropeptide FF receptor 1-like [Oculina patagonica]